MRPKGVVDEKQVNIPVLSVTAKGGRRKLDSPGDGYPGLSVKVERIGKSVLSLTLRRDDELHL